MERKKIGRAVEQEGEGDGEVENNRRGESGKKREEGPAEREIMGGESEQKGEIRVKEGNNCVSDREGRKEYEVESRIKKEVRGRSG